MAITPQATPCIETPWPLARSGYGRKMIAGIRWSAHRYAWVQARGAIPEGMVVCHKCDNPPCINIEHLFLGTPRDNSRDRDAKGRTPAGERHALARLSDAQVRDIRHKAAAGVPITSLMAEYGLSRGGVSSIVYGERRRSSGGPIGRFVRDYPVYFAPDDLVAEVLRLRASGMTLKATARAVGRSYSTVRTWTVNADRIEAWRARRAA